MAEFAASDLAQKAMHVGQYGNLNVYYNFVAPTSGANASVYIPVRVPAGIFLTDFHLNVPVLDGHATPTMQAKVGFRPVDSTVGPTIDDDYFAAAGAFGRTAARVEYAFAPFAVEYAIDIIITLTAQAATFASGNLWGIVKGENRGAK